MKYALEVWSNDAEQTLRTCHAAEALRYDAFYYGESPTGLNLDCWTLLGGLARETRRMRLGAVIANILPEYRSLVLLAKQVATTAVLSQGRVDFRTGIGASSAYAASWWQPAGVRYPAYSTRLDDLDAALTRLRRLWAGQTVRLSDDQREDDFSLGLACPQIPITVAASSPAGMRVAAQHADVWEASFRTAREYRALAGQFDASAETVRALEVDVFVADSPTELAGLYARLGEERGAGLFEAVLARSIHGLPAEIGAQLDALEDAGVDQLLLAFHDPHDLAALETFARVMNSRQKPDDHYEVEK